MKNYVDKPIAFKVSALTKRLLSEYLPQRIQYVNGGKFQGAPFQRSEGIFRSGIECQQVKKNGKRI
jgi:hypothetical protein